jgi:hypothetical protein
MEHEQRRKRERGALGLSVLLHGLIAPLFVALVVGVDDLRPEGKTATSGLFSISVLHRAAPAPVRPAPSHHAVPREAALVSLPRAALHPRVVAASQQHKSGTPNKTRRVAFVAPPPTPIPTPKHIATTARPRSAAPVSQPASASTEQAAQNSAAPVETATEPPTPPPTPAAVLVDAPVGGWGQNFRDPVVLDDGALAALRARYHGAIAHVDVDEEGHATHVSVQGPGLDAEALAALERRLFDLRYVPAECNGLRCAASLELRV